MTDPGRSGPRSPPIVLAALAVGLVSAAAAGPWLHRTVGGVAWLLLLAAWAIAAFAGARLTTRCSRGTALAIVLVAAALMRLPLLIETPYLSSDMYRYIWDGRVQRSGINPYIHVPAAPEVAHLRDPAIYPHINRADYAPTIYPPGAQLIFRAVTALSDSVLAMKLGLLAFEALAIAALVALLAHLGRPAGLVAAYAWHPLPVWEIAGNGHVDAALLGLTLLALALFLRGRVSTAGAVAALAALVKPTALLLFPVLWRPWNWQLPATLLGIAVLFYAPFLSAGWGVFGFLGGYVAEEGLTSGGGFRYLGLLQSLTGPIPRGGTIYVLLTGAILGAIALCIGFRTDRSAEAAISAYALLLTVFLLVLTPHYPWYYLALGPLLVLTRAVTPWVLMTGSFLLYDVVAGDRLPPFALREGAVHLAALSAFAFDCLKPREPAPVGSTGDIRA